MTSLRAVISLASVLFAWLVLAAPSAVAASALGGVVTDARTGKPIAGATVTLYRVPGWSARSSSAQNSTPNTCESNASKGSNPWSQPAPTNQGQQVDPSSGQISPAVNPLITNAQGRFSWTVPAGCWFVLVTNPPSYSPVTSPVVGVPTDVRDLNIEMTTPSSQGGSGGGSGGDGVGSNGTSSHPTAGNPAHLSCVVPRLIGRRLKDAKKALAKAHCKVGRISRLRVKHSRKNKRVEAGTIIRQALRPGVRKLTGSKVAITIAK